MQTQVVSHSDYVHYLFFWRLYSKISRLRNQESSDAIFTNHSQHPFQKQALVNPLRKTKQ